MIIRMSVNDNDFTCEIEKYLMNFWSNILETKELSAENALEQYHLNKKLNSMLNPNMNHKLTEDDKAFVVKSVKDSFAYWSTKNTSDTEYLTKNLDVKIQETLEDKCEDGVAVYWFQHSGTVVAQ